MRPHASLAAAFCLCLTLDIGAARGAEEDASGWGDLWNRDTLLGDLGGLRSGLKPYGITFALSETSEILGNVSGGIRRGAIYEGLTDASLQIDLRTRYAWPGVIFARAFQIRGRGLTANNLDDLDTGSSIEALRTTRLFELWYEHYVSDWVRLKVGQQAADQEFLVSSRSALFVNGTFGFPTLPSVNLPSGGPAYPLATPAVRLRVDPSEEWSLTAAVFNGDPAGPGPGDPQARDASGTAFRTGDGALVFGEIRYNPGNTASNGTYKFGFWYNAERFADQHFDTAGVSLASPLSNGMARLHGGNYSVYGVIDQPLFHDRDSDAGLAVFARMMGSPGDRNLVDFYVDGGVTYKGPFGRESDAIGLGFAFVRIGTAARQLDADQAALSGTPYPVRSSERLIELTYQFQITPWWQVQPDFQYVINPSGGIPNPNASAGKIRNAAVFGLRTVITF